jgi:hypothetical protein
MALAMLLLSLWVAGEMGVGGVVAREVERVVVRDSMISLVAVAKAPILVPEEVATALEVMAQGAAEMAVVVAMDL